MFGMLDNLLDKLGENEVSVICTVLKTCGLQVCCCYLFPEAFCKCHATLLVAVLLLSSWSSLMAVIHVAHSFATATQS